MKLDELNARLDGWAPQVLSILRIMTGLLFLEHGVQKILGFPEGPTVPLLSLIGLAGLIELIGGALVVLGLFTRICAFIISGEMAFAYFIAHAPRNFWPLLNGGDLAVTWCFVFLYLAAAGGGPISLDRLLRKV